MRRKDNSKGGCQSTRFGMVSHVHVTRVSICMPNFSAYVTKITLSANLSQAICTLFFMTFSLHVMKWCYKSLSRPRQQMLSSVFEALINSLIRLVLG